MADQRAAVTETQIDPTPDKAPVETKEGVGVAAVQALLRNGKPPDPKQLVAIIDANRGERDAIFTLLHTTLGNAYVQQVVEAMGHVRASIERREVVAGDPSNPEAGSFVASQAEQGAQWRTAGGGFTGRVDKQGLDSHVRLDQRDSLHAHVGADRSGTLGWERDGKTEGELYGHHKSGTDWEAGARRTWGLEGGAALTTGLRHQVTGAGATDGATAAYRSGDGKTTADAALGYGGGHVVGSAHATHQIGAHDSVSGSIAHDQTGTTTLGASGSHQLASGATVAGSAELKHQAAGTTGSIAGSYRDPRTQIDGSVVRGLDRTTLSLGGTEQISPQLQVGGRLTHEQPDRGQGQSTLSLTERAHSGKFVQGLDITAGHGARDYVSATGSIDAQLGDHLYGGGFGTFGAESGKHTTAQLGASLTFTPNEKTALTLAGILDEHGTLETRLQLDVFKSKIANVGDLASHKKDALVSIFVSYSQQGTSRLDDRYGAAQLGTSQPAGGGQVMGGIKIKF